MTYSEALHIIGLIWTVALTFYMRSASTKKDLDEKLDTVKNDLNGIGERITRCETQIKDGPSHRDLAELHEKVNHVGTELSKLSGYMEINGDLLRQIHLILINHLNEFGNDQRGK